jgi:hypothetical protein
MYAAGMAPIRRPGLLTGGPGVQGVVEMTREADVVRSLVEMADTLAGDYNVVDLLTGWRTGASTCSACPPPG